MPDARTHEPPVIHDTAPVVPRRLQCSHCTGWTLVFEIPHPYLDRDSFVCGECRDTDRLEAAAQAEAEDRRGSMFQVPALPFNERNAT